MNTNTTIKTDKKPIKGPTMVDLLSAMKSVGQAITNPESVVEVRRTALNDKIGNSIVDTVIGYDTGRWETGIVIDGAPWVIVEQYDNKAEAEAGHEKYVKEVKAGKKKFFDTQMEGTFEW